MGNFCLENKHYPYSNINLEIIFYCNKCIYKYTTTLASDTTLSNKATFKNERIYQKKYCKSYINTIYEDDGFEEVSDLGELPEDTSKLFFILKKKNTNAVYFNCDGEGVATYNQIFKLMKTYMISPKVLLSVLKIFDSNIQDFTQIDEHQYKLVYNTKEQILSENELIYTLSSGTTKGMLLYILVVASLKNGFDLLVDEIENHFHKTLVENVISLYKDKSVNKSHATISFTTHYCEVLDLFNRQDNIWITKCDKKVYIENMYSKYNVRSGILKSNQFYNDAFETSVNYEDLMALKKELMV
jgi:hypothetical protein